MSSLFLPVVIGIVSGMVLCAAGSFLIGRMSIRSVPGSVLFESIPRVVLLENDETNGNLAVEILKTDSVQWLEPGVKHAIWRVRVGDERGPFLTPDHRWEHAER